MSQTACRSSCAFVQHLCLLLQSAASKKQERLDFPQLWRDACWLESMSEVFISWFGTLAGAPYKSFPPPVVLALRCSHSITKTEHLHVPGSLHCARLPRGPHLLHPRNPAAFSGQCQRSMSVNATATGSLPSVLVAALQPVKATLLAGLCLFSAAYWGGRRAESSKVKGDNYTTRSVKSKNHTPPNKSKKI